MNEAERYPTLSEHGRAMLKFMSEHPQAPIYRNQSGNKLNAQDLLEVQDFEDNIASKSVDWRIGEVPAWLQALAQQHYLDVPHYRALGGCPERFEDIPTTSRADLAADIAQFVPDSLDLNRLINFQTTGTSGNPMLIASHPQVAARYLPYHKKALRRFGIELQHGRGQVGVVLIGHQSHCFTYVSVTPSMGESGLAKINLHPNDWRDPGDREAYLDALKAEVFTGDPLSFSALLNIPIHSKPKALISVGMMLADGLKQALQAHCGAPVIDIYSMNEAGPIAVWDEDLRGHVLLQANLYIEILNAEGEVLAPGEVGEITLSGGFNFCMPLLRYRTGDYAALSHSAEGPVLQSLSGRAPVRFYTEGGEWINNIDVTHALRPLNIAQFALHQSEQGALTLRLARGAMAQADAARLALRSLFGSQSLHIQAIEAEDKVIQYSSDFPGGNL